MNQANKQIIEPFPHKIAEISQLLSDLSQQEQSIESNRRNREARQQHERQAENLRQQLLAQADYSLVYNYMEATSIADKNAFRTTWQQNFPSDENKGWLEFVHSYSLDLASLPFGSFYIQFKFKLLKPYISRDDNQFYIVDNPIVRDKVFRYPMVRPTAWKGSLRHALWQLGYQEEDKGNRGKQIKRLFGNANDEKSDENKQDENKLDDKKSGRLYFYPTFFTQTSLEIINPHDRQRRVGKNPILIESVPIGATGTFTLLYTPPDRIGRNEAKTRQQVFDDLQLVAAGLQALFTLYGFGAKTSSGFGLASDVVENGRLTLSIPEVVFLQDNASQVPKPDDEYLKYLDETGRVEPAFEGGGDGGLMSNNEYKRQGQQHGGGSLSEFKNFRRWYGEYGERWQTHLQTTVAETPHATSKFERLSQLVTLCQNLELKTDTTIGGDA